jgi:hypothetical protein
MMAIKKLKTESGRKPEEPVPETNPANASLDAKRRPLRTIRVDDCSASIWAREYVVQGQPKLFYTVMLERSYKDRDGLWKYSRSFDPESLGKIVALCQQASEVIHELTLEHTEHQAPQRDAEHETSTM